MSALPPKADIRPRDRDVCFGPLTEVEGLYSIGSSECVADRRTQRERHCCRPL